MLLATHFTVGLAIGSRSATPEIAFVLGFLSHFLLDRIPHWDGVEASPEDGKVHWKDHKNLIAVWREIAITALLVWYALSRGMLAWNVHLPVFWGAFGALLPDMLWIPHHLLGLNRPRRFFEFHLHIQREADRLPSVLFQLALIVFGFIVTR